MEHTDRAVYERLARALDTVPNGYPPTASGVEVDLLAELFSAELAEVAAVMDYRPLTVAEIAARAGLSAEETAARLRALSDFGAAERLAAEDEPSGAQTEAWRLGPFWPGIFDALMPNMSRTAAELMERYMTQGGARGIMGADPPIGRVLPAPEAARTDVIMPYDDVRRVVEETTAVTITDCVCRLDRATMGSPCSYPVHICMILHDAVPEDPEGLVSKEEVLQVLAEADRLGLVHVATNVGHGWEFVCNCCGCCCHFLRALTEWKVENAVVSNYEAVVDLEACTGCGTCEERCQIGAVTVVAGGEPGDHSFAVVDAAHCIGCGVCVTGCPNEAVTLRRLPEARVTAPPADLEAWGAERLGNR